MNASGQSGRDSADGAAARVQRVALPGAVEDRLFYAQVREDARLELAVLQPAAADSLVVVSSGGCTALSLLAAGAGKVVAVDLNRAQNHLVELKFVAAAGDALPHAGMLEFLGACAGTPRQRLAAYGLLRSGLSPAAREYWDGRRPDIARGILGCGVTERFIGTVVAALRAAVHPQSRIERLLRCPSLAAQQEFFAREWNTWRWRWFFRLLLNRAVFRRTYDPAFFRHVANPSFAEHFRACAEYALTQLPVGDNYFLHHMFTGRYPVGVPGGVPAYLTATGCRTLAAGAAGLQLVDGGLTGYLRTVPAGSVTGFALSNICEWLPPAAVDELFEEVARTAVDGARVCLRNFVGWTEVPARWQHQFIEDRARGESLMKQDRSLVNRRFAVCAVTRP